MTVFAEVFTPANLRFMLQGLGMSLAVAGISIITSLVLGSLLGAGKMYGSKPLRVVISVYIEIFRTTPNLLWILIIYFLVPMPRQLDLFTRNCLSGVLAFTLFTSAVIAELVRGGLNSVDVGQQEAARALGFSMPKTFWLVLLPQALRASLPAILGQIITVIKDTSLLAGVNIAELTVNSRIVMGGLNSSQGVLLVFLFMAVVYFSINFSLSIAIRRLTKRRKGNTIKMLTFNIRKGVDPL